MLSGKRFKLREPVIATTLEENGQRVAAMIPASSVIEIISGPGVETVSPPNSGQPN